MYTRATPGDSAGLENTQIPEVLMLGPPAEITEEVWLQPEDKKVEPAVRIEAEVYAVKVAPDGMLNPFGAEQKASGEAV